MIRAGSIILDSRGRQLRLETRVKIAGRKGWEASPVENGKADSRHLKLVLDSEIIASQVPEGFQCLLVPPQPSGETP